MKLIWHIIGKDIRRNTWPLVFWILLFVAQTGLGILALWEDGPNLEWADWIQRVDWMLVTMRFITGYILVTQFVQDDELTGTRMFWLTRPISARRLLAAKGLGI